MPRERGMEGGRDRETERDKERERERERQRETVLQWTESKRFNKQNYQGKIKKKYNIADEEAALRACMER